MDFLKFILNSISYLLSSLMLNYDGMQQNICLQYLKHFSGYVQLSFIGMQCQTELDTVLT